MSADFGALDGLRVRHGELDAAAEAMYNTVKKMDDSLNSLESDVAPKVATWSGDQQEAYKSAKAAWDWAMQELKDDYLRQAAPVAKVHYDSKIHVVQHALGLHTAISRVQGNRLKAKHEIRIASVFRDSPLPFLRMIAVHELAHLKEKEHDKAFYKLCCWMEPDYHQLEFDLRLYLTWLDLGGRRLWTGDSDTASRVAI